MVKAPSSDLGWKPKITRSDRKWSSRTLILETERYIQARNTRLNPPLLPEPSSKRIVNDKKEAKALEMPLALQLPALELPVERRKQARPGLAIGLFLGGFTVLFLDVLSIHDGLDAVFFLSLFLGIILIVQGLNVFMRIRWPRSDD